MKIFSKPYPLFVIFFAGLFLLGAGCPLTIITDKTGVGSDGGVFQTPDKGETWQQRVFVAQAEKNLVTISALNVHLMVFDPQNADTIYIGTLANGIYKTVNKGEKWDKLPIDGLVVDIDVHPKDSNTMYSVVGLSVFKSIDGGATWGTIYLDSRGQYITALLIDWYNPSRILVSTARGEILESNDEGVTWQVIGKIDRPVTKLFMDPLDSRRIFAITAPDSLFVSTDGGQSWNPYLTEQFVKYPGSVKVNDMVFYVSNPDIIYLATDYGLLRLKRSAGDELTEVPTLVQARALPIKTFAVDPANDQEILFPVGRIIHKTTNGGQSWKVIETFPSKREIISLAVDPTDGNIIYAGTFFLKK